MEGNLKHQIVKTIRTLFLLVSVCEFPVCIESFMIITFARLVSACKELDLNFDIPPARLKQGYGDGVLAVLQSLVDKVLEAEIHYNGV